MEQFEFSPPEKDLQGKFTSAELEGGMTTAKKGEDHEATRLIDGSPKEVASEKTDQDLNDRK